MSAPRSKRGRPYYRMPREFIGWYSERLNAFCDARNRHYARDMRMIARRRLV